MSYWFTGHIRFMHAYGVSRLMMFPYDQNIIACVEKFHVLLSLSIIQSFRKCTLFILYATIRNNIVAKQFLILSISILILCTMPHNRQQRHHLRNQKRAIHKRHDGITHKTCGTTMQFLHVWVIYGYRWH